VIRRVMFASRHMSATNAMAFSSEVDTGSREENASKQESGAAVLIQSEPIMLEWDKPPEHLRGLIRIA
jgi:hypothetical protein